MTILTRASIAQLGDRQTEDLKALCSIHSRGSNSFCVVVGFPTTPTFNTADRLDVRLLHIFCAATNMSYILYSRYHNT